MGVLIAIIVTIVCLSLLFTAIYVLIEGHDILPTTKDHPAVTAFLYIVAFITAFALMCAICIFFWLHAGIERESAHVGDIRCQRYESHFNGKTTTYEWKTVDCVDISGR